MTPPSGRTRPSSSGTKGRTPGRVLDATLDLLGHRALRDISVEDVAVAAGVSRQTVYRHFGSRDGLFRAVVVREEERLAEAARAAVADATRLEDAVAIATTALLRSVRQHPLLDRLLADDPETLLPYLALGQGPVLGTAGSIVAELVQRFVPHDRDLVDELAEVLSRLLISYTMAPGERSPDEVGRLAARLVVGGLAGPASGR